MREQRTLVTGNTTLSEALESASGGFVFLLGVGAMGVLVGVAGWTAARYPIVAMLLGFTMLAAIALSAVWGLLRWAAVEPEAPRRGASPLHPQDQALRHAA